MQRDTHSNSSDNEQGSAQKSWSCDLRCALQSSLAQRNTEWERLAARIISLCRKSLSSCVSTVSRSRRRNRIVPGQCRARNRIVDQSNAHMGKVRSENCRRKCTAQPGKLWRRNSGRTRKDRGSKASVPGHGGRHCRRNSQKDARRSEEEEPIEHYDGIDKKEEEKDDVYENDRRQEEEEDDEEMLQAEESFRWTFNNGDKEEEV
jgi:hypothetical protein